MTKELDIDDCCDTLEEARDVIRRLEAKVIRTERNAYTQGLKDSRLALMGKDKKPMWRG